MASLSSFIVTFRRNKESIERACSMSLLELPVYFSAHGLDLLAVK